jgi:hypothetical protein
MKAINSYSKTSYDERDTLFVEFHSSMVSADSNGPQKRQTEFGFGVHATTPIMLDWRCDRVAEVMSLTSVCQYRNWLIVSTKPNKI